MLLAVAFAFLAACGFASGNVLVRIGTQRTPAPTAALLTVLSGMVLILSLALLLNMDDIKSLSKEAMAWIVLMGIMPTQGPHLKRNSKRGNQLCSND